MIVWAMIQASSPSICIPKAAGDVDLERARRSARNIGSLKTGCTPDSTGVIQCSPESMRATTEAKLRSLGLYGPREKLSMAVYAMARNIHSEAGNRATGAEKLAIGETLVTRARQKGVTQLKLMTRNGKFAKQRGCNPCVSSARDPAWEDIYAAELILSGRSGNISQGATHYFSPRAMDNIKRQRAAQGRSFRDRFELYDEWTSGGDLLTWVGYIPGVDFERQMFFRKMPKTPAGRAEHARVRPIGRKALTSRMPLSIFRAPECRFTERGGNVLLAGTIMLGAALPAFMILRYGGRT